MTHPGSRRGRWLIAGGVVGLAIRGPVLRAATRVVRRIVVVAHHDPVAPFLLAPCERSVSPSSISAHESSS